VSGRVQHKDTSTHVRAGARPVDGEHANVVSRETPHSERTTKRRNPCICALEHAICRKGIVLLTSGFRLNVGYAGTDIVCIIVAMALAELDLFLQLFLLVLQPLRNLLPAEGKLTRAVGKIKNGQRVL
jgi:hypothetical protein